MARPSDIEASAAELMLVDLLYGEVDGDEAEAARAVIDGDSKLAAEAEAYRGLRELMRELPDQEPPAAISAQLLHAAATQAPAPAAAAKVAAEGGLWASIKGFFAPVVMHPAMAAVATLVLVAGVAGTLYLRGDVEVAQPPVPSAATAPAAAEKRARLQADEPVLAPDPTTLTTGEQDEGIVDLRLEGTTLPSGAPVQSHTGRKGASAPADSAATARKPVRDRKPLGKLELGEGERRGLDKHDPASPPPVDEAKKVVVDEDSANQDKVDRVDDKANDYRNVSAGDDDSYRDGEDVGARAPEEPAPTPVAGGKKAPSKEVNAKASSRTEVRELHARALRAAGKRDCAAVASLGERIRKLDRAYYDEVFLRDSKLALCNKQQRK